MTLAIDGQPLRVYGSTGQLRSAAIALKLLELATLRVASRLATNPVDFDRRRLLDGLVRYHGHLDLIDET